MRHGCGRRRSATTRDRVLAKSDGDTTYLLADLAYHRDKFESGWEHLIDIWGADHHGQVKSIQAGMEALGYPAGEPEVILGQLVKLERGGELVRLSRRAGTIITLADILDEVDPDVARLTFLLQSIDTTQTFDLDVVTAQSMENPVYYVQYAHARIASIGRRAAVLGIARLPLLETDLGVLVHDRESSCCARVAQYPDVLAEAAELHTPHHVHVWAREFAKSFHGFYRDCRVIGDDDALTQARLWLAEACRIGSASALDILGVHAPDEMTRARQRRGRVMGAADAPIDLRLLPRSAVLVDGGMSDNPRPVPTARATRPGSRPGRRGARRPSRSPGSTASRATSWSRTPICRPISRWATCSRRRLPGRNGHCMASNYNVVPRPAVVFVRDGSGTVVVRRETVDDLMLRRPGGRSDL